MKHRPLQIVIDAEAFVDALAERTAARLGPAIAAAVQGAIRTIHGIHEIQPRGSAPQPGPKTERRSPPDPAAGTPTERKGRGRPRNADVIPTAMAVRPWWTMAELCATLGKTKAAMGMALYQLTKAGVIVRDPSVAPNSPRGQRYALTGTPVAPAPTTPPASAPRKGSPPCPKCGGATIVRRSTGLIICLNDDCEQAHPAGRRALAPMHGADRAERRARKLARADKAAPGTAAVEEVADLIACHRPGLWLAVDGVVELLAEIKKTQLDPLTSGTLRLKLGPVLERGHALGLLEREGADRYEWRYRAQGTRAPHEHVPCSRRGRKGRAC